MSSATWAMGAGGIATRDSGATDEADRSGSYPRWGLPDRPAWFWPARISIRPNQQPALEPEGALSSDWFYPIDWPQLSAVSGQRRRRSTLATLGPIGASQRPVL